MIVIMSVRRRCSHPEGDEVLYNTGPLFILPYLQSLEHWSRSSEADVHKNIKKEKKCDRPTNEWRHSGVYHRVKTQLTENKPLIVLYYTGETDRWKEPTNGSPIEMHS